MSTLRREQGGEGDGPVPGWVLRLALGAFWVGSVALITLTPGGAPRPDAELIPSLCLFCGTKGLADAVLNTVLFLPLGLIMGVRRGVGAAILAGFVVSAGIETAQLTVVPGRNPAVGDLVWNSLGAGMGALLTGALRRWLGGGEGPPLPAGAAAVGLGGVYLVLAGVLLVPVGTQARYFGQWTPELGHLDRYEGTLLEAWLDGEAVPRGPYPRGESPRGELEGDFTLEARVVKGPPPHGIAPVVSIYDGRRREILLLGAHGEDLVFRERTRAQAVGLDIHDLRVEDALAPYAVGDTLGLGARRVGGVICLRVADQDVCGAGVTPGRTWGLLMTLESAPPWFRLLLDAAWMATLFVLAGVVAGGARGVVLWAAVSAALVALAVAGTPLVAGPVAEWVGLAAGIAA
ncbi:MAG TPA: VanZ family protein, partial [Longimicrobiales bacterium]|nr:VanZ family protein [Longimicrobiales bacterium]